MKRIEPGDPIVILTGAGIQRNSGLDTFRDAGGVWTRVRLEDAATPEAFERDPDRVHGFYNARRRTLRDSAAQPNAAHAALARLEHDWLWPGAAGHPDALRLHAACSCGRSTCMAS